MPGAKNVLGGPLKTCSTDPLTGFYRDGCCNTGAEDEGLHTICCQVTAEFLAHQRERTRPPTVELGKRVVEHAGRLGAPNELVAFRGHFRSRRA